MYILLMHTQLNYIIIYKKIYNILYILHTETISNLYKPIAILDNLIIYFKELLLYQIVEKISV